MVNRGLKDKKALVSMQVRMQLDMDTEGQSCEQSWHDGDYTKVILAGSTEFEVSSPTQQLYNLGQISFCASVSSTMKCE